MGDLVERLDDIPRPAWIALVVLSFIVFWPVGLALLIYLKWSGRMFGFRGCYAGPWGHWSSPEGRDARRSAREEWRSMKRQARWGRRQGWSNQGSGNVAFDEYRDATLRKLDEEQREFHDYLDRLRSAKDRAEFDQFMRERGNQPPPPPMNTPPATN